VGDRDYLTTSEFARLQGLSRATIARLIDRGRLPARRVGSQRRLFKSDLEAAGLLPDGGRPLLRKTALSRDEVLEFAPRIKQVAAQHGARNVRLFGSLARGTADEASDVDLLVDLDPDRSLIDLAGLELDLEALLETRVDVGTVASLKPRMKEQVLAESVEL
jgi:excisionase family DNA binding protein